MAVGSAFDAFVKKELGAEDHFDRQVEEHNREFARTAGQKCFDAYVSSGAYRRLQRGLGEAVQMEFTARHDVRDVPLSGKPDLVYLSPGGVYVIHDWKVNGFMSRASPVPGYVWSSKHGNCHKDAFPSMHGDVMINLGGRLRADWETQLCVYAWTTYVEVGQEFIGAIDQLVCADGEVVTCCEHRVVIGPEVQEAVFERFRNLWEIVNSNWIFRGMSEAESAARCKALDGIGAAFEGEYGDMLRLFTGRG